MQRSTCLCQIIQLLLQMGQLMSYSVEVPPPTPVAEVVAKYESPFTVRNLVLCMPSFSMVTSLIFINVVSVPFYASIGVKPEFLLLFVAISRAFDAVVDPFVAHWYESIRPDYANEHTIRYQACIAGGLMCALTIGLHLGPPTSIHSDGGLLAWFAITYLLYSISFSFVAIPITALQWQAFPYLGSKDQNKRTTLALCCELIQNLGLAIVFLMSGFSSANKASNIDDTSVYDSCYSASGTGRSCMIHPDTAKRLQYNIFDPDMWQATDSSGYDDYNCRIVHGEIQSDPAVLYNPASCVTRSDISYNASCITNYCACVGECSNLHNLALREDSVSAAGWLLFTTFLLAMVALPIYVYGWENIYKSPKPRKRGISTDGAATETAQPSAQPLEPLVPKLINLFRNKVVRSFLLPWLLDSVVFMTVLGTMCYYIRGVIKPEYALLPIDCNEAIPIFGDVSDSWRCQNRAITALLLALIMFSAVLASFVWYYLGRMVGNVRAWQLGSLMSFLSILALVFSASRNAVSKALGLGLLIGVGMGSRFLSDTIVVDVIHYYEFISGYQYQHLFAMFKLLFLKVSVVFMHMLPVAVYYDVGFNPVPPQYQKTPFDIGMESSLAQFFTIAIPSVLCVTSFVLKMHFRLVDDEQFDLTAEGIRVLYHKHGAAGEGEPVTPTVGHSDKKPDSKSASSKNAPAGSAAPADVPVISAVDPTSGILYPADNLTYKEMQGALIFSHFVDTQCTIDFYSCAHSQSPYIGVDLLINRRRDAAAICFFLIIALAVGLVFASDGLYHASGLLFVPLMMIIAMGWVVFAGYCAGQSLQTAILLKDPAHQPAVETLDKVIRNLDTLEDIALVNLPTREVLRRYRVMKAEGIDLSTHSGSGAASHKSGKPHKKDSKGNIIHEKKNSKGHEASKEMRDLIAAEALKASIPTKEMEVMEWEQALFRAAKRSVARAKVPTQRTLKLVKTLQRSSRLQSGNREPALTRWEAEFYSYIASQHRKDNRSPKAGSSSQHTGSGTAEGDSDEDSISTASIDTTESERGGDDAATRRARAKSVRPEQAAASVVPAAPATRPLSRAPDSVDSVYFKDLGSYSFDVGDQSDHEREGKEESSSHFSVSSEDLDQSIGAPVTVATQVMPPSMPSMPSTQFSTTSHFDLGDEADGSGSEGSEGGSGSEGEGGSGDEDEGSDGEDEGSDIEISSEDSFGASKPSSSKPQSAASGNLVHASVIRAGSSSSTRSGPRRASQFPHKQRSDTVGFDDDFADDGDVDYSLPGDSDGEEEGDAEMPSPPSSAGDSAYTSAFVSRAPSGIPSMVSSPAVTHSASKPPLGPNSAERTAPVAAPQEEAGQNRSRSFSSPQSIDLGDPTQAVLRFDEPVVSNDTRETSGEGRARGESIALSIDIHDSDDDDVLSSMSEGDMVEAPAAKAGIADVKQRVLSAKKKQDKDDDAASVDYSLPSDD